MSPNLAPHRARPSHIDAALMTLLGLLALASVLVSAGGGEQVSVVLLAIVLSAATIIVGSLLIGHRRHTQRRILPAMLAAVLSLSVIVSVAAAQWPLRAAYALSRDSFDAVAQRVRNGEHITMPLRAGLFTIRRAELSPDGIVCLWTRPNPGGSTGFVQCPRDHVPFNLWSIIRLDDRWQFISED
jgi:uncharacterized membrane protein SirB2